MSATASDEQRARVGEPATRLGELVALEVQLAEAAPQHRLATAVPHRDHGVQRRAVRALPAVVAVAQPEPGEHQRLGEVAGLRGEPELGGPFDDLDQQRFLDREPGVPLGARHGVVVQLAKEVLHPRHHGHQPFDAPVDLGLALDEHAVERGEAVGDVVLGLGELAGVDADEVVHPVAVPSGDVEQPRVHQPVQDVLGGVLR